jgi:hypothetical protein
MRQPTPKSCFRLPMVVAVFALLLPLASWAQTAQTQKQDRWLHVRVESSQPKNETVRVNVPLELAEKVLPAINQDHLRNGKVKIDPSEANGVDLRALFDAIRTAKDGEFVTVQSNDSDVRVAKQAGYLLVHVHEKGSAKKDQVEIRVPMKVAEALLSAAHDELDILAAVRALSLQGDTELVSVKSDEETVRIWLDSKNLSE